MEDTLEGLFFPESIALYGIPRGIKPGKVFLLGLLDQGSADPSTSSIRQPGRLMVIGHTKVLIRCQALWIWSSSCLPATRSSMHSINAQGGT